MEIFKSSLKRICLGYFQPMTSLQPRTASQAVWAIEELVHLICSYTLRYGVPDRYDERTAHHGLVVFSRGTLARGVLYLNRFISRVAVKLLWKELGSVIPLYALLPQHYSGRARVSCLYRSTH